MKSYYALLSTLVIIFIAFVLLWQIPEFRLALTGKAASPEESPTTVNVTIGGLLGSIKVNKYPINFTVEPGLQPATSENPKQRDPEGVGYTTVRLNASNNVDYDIYMNASNLVGGTGQTIPVSNLKVNTTCNGSTPLGLTSLSTSFKEICVDVFRDNSTNIYFYLDIPAGQYNDTYSGDVWFFVNSSDTTGQDHIWHGIDNTTTTVKRYIEFEWNSSSVTNGISFGTMNPGETKNATDTTSGWPASFTSGTATNVYIDIYINGTDLDCLGTTGLCSAGTDYIGVANVTYSNATTDASWPDGLEALSKTMPGTSEGGDFSNWGHVGNATTLRSRWNMSVPTVLSGAYGGNVYAKAVEEGEDPTP